jgi:hypothetical protein
MGQKRGVFMRQQKEAGTGAWTAPRGPPAPLSGSGIVREFMLGVRTEVEFQDIVREEKAVRVRPFVPESCPQEGAWEQKQIWQRGARHRESARKTKTQVRLSCAEKR